ncbi:MAG: nucleotidyltransferase family protein [Candidatus Thiodiazotropha sp.]
MTQIQGILLAAGSGVRFGSQKLLHPLPTGELMGIAAARNLITALPNTLAVIRPQDSQLAHGLVDLGVSLVENSEAEKGMGLSLSKGVKASADAQGWIVALADMPWITPETIRSVFHALQQGASMAAPVYQGRRGHPVGFGRKWRQPLQTLQGDAGARHLLSSHSDELLLLPSDDPAVLLDIDHKDDPILSSP